MQSKLQQIVQFISNKGIPIPLIRDNKLGRGSISYTLLIVAGLTVVASIGTNLAAYVCSTYFGCGEPKYFPMTDVLMWFGTCAGLYWGRTPSPGKEDNAQTNS